ncbi:rhomboid family intramembrane serine protease [Myroides marinus]|uniref:rhomboid family intramembrane serine protease n=1 Tax=Myroides marinus TaxID=703342 RepID=UPI002576633A|nr:rhomboid family intramembrane serine protease [Myroides marinus]MDM1534348.1 rhomboid family intramembrane serine protease [Myroides marinus]MDM1541314.1 rhomboid family intramembrane serine protease [Myroides marinus]
MKVLLEKMRLIFLPFVGIVFFFLWGYTLLNWVITIQLGVDIKEDLTSFWIPMGLAAVLVYWLLYPRIKLLQFKNENYHFLYAMLAIVTMWGTTIMTQNYLLTSTGKLTHLEDVTQLVNQKQTKYYTLGQYYIDKNNITKEKVLSISGRHNDNFNMNIYVAMPIHKRFSTKLESNHKYWLAKNYSKTIDNRCSESEKEYQYRRFLKEVNIDFSTETFNDFTFLEVLGNTGKRRDFQTALQNKGQSIEGSVLFFKAHTEAFENRNKVTLKWILLALGVGTLLFFILLLKPKFHKTRLQNFKTNKTKRNNELLYLFVPQKGFFVTPIILNLNIILSIYMLFAYGEAVSIRSQDLLDIGANYRPLVLEGQWWRLLTNIFLHGGLMHLFVNMAGLLFISIFLEKYLGSIRYAAVYLISGVFASLCSIWWCKATISVGASGAIFGLYGFLLVSLLRKNVPRDMDKGFLIIVCAFIGVNLLMGLSDGIDNAAHIGGLISGLILGLFMSKYVRDEE